VGKVALTGNIRIAYRVLVRRPERKINLGRPRHREDNNVKMDLQEVCWRSMEWIYLAQNRDKWRALLNAVLNNWVPQNSGNSLTS